jgi:apolipoprotein N-acyltransferase
MARLEAPTEGRRSAPFYAVWLMLPGVAGFGLVFTAGAGAKRRRNGFLALLALALVMSTLLAGCGGGSEMDLAPGTPTGTHNITVTATTGNVQRTASVTIVVQ